MYRLDAVYDASGVVNLEAVLARYDHILNDRSQLRLLKRDPGIEQRTPEWHEARRALVTASDIAQALGQGKFGTQKEFVAKKVEPAPPPPRAGDPPSHFLTCPPLKWGTMFEDVATAIYARRTGSRVYEFGLLPHPDPAVRIGASPDGITDLGVMLEIKCPYRRPITGEVPMQYYYQIQGQLEVCRLRSCDYLECEFSKYRNSDEFEIDVLDETDGVTPEKEEEELDDIIDPPLLPRFGVGCNGREKGVIAEYCSEDGHNVYYKYGRVAPTGTEYRKWMRERLCDAADGGDADRSCFQMFHFWRLELISIVRVNRDDSMISDMLKDVRDIWGRVLEFREDADAYERYTKEGAKPARLNATAAATTLPSPPPPPSREAITAPSNNVESLIDYAFKVEGDEDD
jgi:putative phage-type endonuclease